jgi:hypothetical protein
LCCYKLKIKLLMTVIDIDETTEAGRRILRQLAEHPEAGKVREYEIPCDESGNPAGYAPLREVFSEVDEKLSAAYGVDFAKAARLVESGELTLEEVTDEWLLSPELKYEAYSGCLPAPLPAGFKPDPDMLTALSGL